MIQFVRDSFLNTFQAAVDVINKHQQAETDAFSFFLWKKEAASWLNTNSIGCSFSQRVFLFRHKFGGLVDSLLRNKWGDILSVSYTAV